MRTIRMKFGGESGEAMNVLGYGDRSQTPGEIIERVKPKARKYFRNNGGEQELKLRDFEEVEQKEFEALGSDLRSIQVNEKTEENYCARNYGYRYKRKNHPKAEGPVGPTRLD